MVNTPIQNFPEINLNADPNGVLRSIDNPALQTVKFNTTMMLLDSIWPVQFEHLSDTVEFTIDLSTVDVNGANILLFNLDNENFTGYVIRITHEILLPLSNLGFPLGRLEDNFLSLRQSRDGVNFDILITDTTLTAFRPTSRFANSNTSDVYTGSLVTDWRNSVYLTRYTSKSSIGSEEDIFTSPAPSASGIIKLTASIIKFPDPS